VAVPILNEFKPDTIHHIINHSGARLLFVGKSVWDNIDHESMPALDGIIAMADYSVISSRNPVLLETATRLETLFSARHPGELRIEDIHYRTEEPEELAMINYTSGTTSSPKGVMLPYRSMWSNLKYALDKMGYNPGERLAYSKKDGRISLSQVTALNYSQWMNGELSFDNAPLSDIIANLQRWYAVEIDCPEEWARQVRMSFAVIRNESIDEILKAMSLVVDINYARENRHVTIIPRESRNHK